MMWRIDEQEIIRVAINQHRNVIRVDNKAVITSQKKITKKRRDELR